MSSWTHVAVWFCALQEVFLCYPLCWASVAAFCFSAPLTSYQIHLNIEANLWDLLSSCTFVCSCRHIMYSGYKEHTLFKILETCGIKYWSFQNSWKCVAFVKMLQILDFWSASCLPPYTIAHGLLWNLLHSQKLIKNAAGSFNVSLDLFTASLTVFQLICSCSTINPKSVWSRTKLGYFKSD